MVISFGWAGRRNSPAAGRAAARPSGCTGSSDSRKKTQSPRQGETAQIKWTRVWVIVARPEGPRRRSVIVREQKHTGLQRAVRKFIWLTASSKSLAFSGNMDFRSRNSFPHIHILTDAWPGICRTERQRSRSKSYGPNSRLIGRK